MLILRRLEEEVKKGKGEPNVGFAKKGEGRGNEDGN